jgi:hypothetical protein
MTALAQAAARRLTYKAHTATTIDPTTNPDPTVDPGSSGGQVIPYAPGLLMDPQRQEFASKEKRPDQQEYDTRLGIVTVPVEIPFALSPKTYQDLLANVLRSSWTSVSNITQATGTSITGTAASSKFTLGASTWAAQGALVGMTFRLTNVTGPNLNKNFTITALTGVDATVYPTPADMVLDTSFTVTFPGRILAPAEAGALVSQFLCFEDYQVDSDIVQVATQTNLGTISLDMPVEGEVTGKFSGIARNVWNYSGAGAPLFTAPTAAAETAHVSQVGGHLLLNGSPIAYLASISNFMATTDAQAVKTGFNANQIAGGITTGDLKITANFDGMLYDTSLLALFLAETVFELQIHLPVSNAANADFIHLFMGRVKLTGLKRGDADSGPVPLSGTIHALRHGVATGYAPGPLLVQDSLSA